MKKYYNQSKRTTSWRKLFKIEKEVKIHKKKDIKDWYFEECVGIVFGNKQKTENDCKSMSKKETDPQPVS